MKSKGEKTELARFLEQYLKNRRLADTPQSYAEFLKGEGSTPEGEAAEGLAGALASYKKSLPTYGEGAESLAADGLLDSGYARWLQNLREAKLASDIKEVGEGLNSAQKSARADYATYLTKYKKAKEPARTEEVRRKEKLIDALLEYEITDYERARTFADGIGYGEEMSHELFDAAMVLLEQRNSLQLFGS